MNPTIAGKLAEALAAIEEYGRTGDNDEINRAYASIEEARNLFEVGAALLNATSSKLLGNPEYVSPEQQRIEEEIQNVF